MMQIQIVQGESKTIEYAITDDAGDPVDLTYLHAQWRVADRYDDAPLITKSLGAGIAYTDPAGGRLTVTLGPADTQLAPGQYRRELRLTSSGYAQSPDIGPVVIVGSIFVS